MAASACGACACQGLCHRAAHSGLGRPRPEPRPRQDSVIASAGPKPHALSSCPNQPHPPSCPSQEPCLACLSQPCRLPPPCSRVPATILPQFALMIAHMVADLRTSSEREQLDQRRSDIEQRLNDVEDVCHANVQKATQAMQRDADTEGTTVLLSPAPCSARKADMSSVVNDSGVQHAQRTAWRRWRWHSS